MMQALAAVVASWLVTLVFLGICHHTAAILGNTVFDVVRNVTNQHVDRHDELFQKFLQCNFTRAKPQRVYVAQDGTGGGGIGNLILKINTVASYAISNGMEYLLPPLDPYGHDDAELYESFFEHKPYSVAMQAANVIQLQCTNKYKTLHHLEHSFPNDTQPWWPIGGVDEFTKANWGGPDNKRCYPTEVVANCDELRPPHKELGPIANHTAAAYSTALLIRFPGSMHYHTNFSLTAPLFRQAYANRQGRIFHAAWAPMIAEHNSVRRSDQCSVLNGKAFAVIGVHIRLGDVAAKFDAETRVKRAAAKPHGNWGGKFVSPQMHLSGLDLVWRTIDPACTKVIIVTDGGKNSPEIQYFFDHAPELDGWKAMNYSSACLDVQYGHAPPGCDVLFFSQSAVSSLDALNLLAYSDVIVASGSQFSRLAAMVGNSLLLNPNYGFEDDKQVTIPLRRPKENETKLPPKPLQKLEQAERRFNHLIMRMAHRQRSRMKQQMAKLETQHDDSRESMLKDSDASASSRQDGATTEAAGNSQDDLEQKAAQLMAENERIQKELIIQQREREKIQKRLERQKEKHLKRPKSGSNARAIRWQR